MPRESKIHYSEVNERGGRYVPPCGTNGREDSRIGNVTCRVCWFHILAGVAPWARGFMDELRGKGENRQLAAYAEALGSRAKFGQIDSISVPGATAAPVDGKVKGLGDGFARAFSQQRGLQKAVSELLALGATIYVPVEPIMGHSGPPAYPVGIQEGQIADQPGDAGQVSDEAHGDFQPPI